MNEKEYEAIAQTLKDSLKANYSEPMAVYNAVEEVSKTLAIKFKELNKFFDDEEFLRQVLLD